MMGIKVTYNTIESLTALDNAGVFNGINEGYGWSTHFKRNASITLTGSIDTFANNHINPSINLIYDNDVYDATINDQDRTWGELLNIDNC